MRLKRRDRENQSVEQLLTRTIRVADQYGFGSHQAGDDDSY
jgi:hypothetical protein